MDITEVAERLNGSQYRDKIFLEMERELANTELVIVYGGSDDLMYFGGAISEEVYVPGIIHFDPVKRKVPTSECENDCPYFLEKLDTLPYVEAFWCAKDQPFAWTYKTKFPHATFDVFDDGESYCRGIVFNLLDIF